MTDYDQENREINAKTPEGDTLSLGSVRNFGVLPGFSPGGDGVFIRPTINVTPGPHLVRCPVCFGRRSEEGMFECVRCSELICEECRDDIRESWCKRCARNRREIVISFIPDEEQESGWRLRLKTDLMEDTWRRELPWGLVSQHSIEPQLDVYPSEEDARLPENVNDVGTDIDLDEEHEDSDWGQLLFQEVFPDDVWDVLSESIRSEINAGNDIRIRLDNLPPVLAKLPWEQLSFPDLPVTYDRKHSILRSYSAGTQKAVLGPIAPPLRVLVVTTQDHEIISGELTDAPDPPKSMIEAMQMDLIELIESDRLIFEQLPPLEGLEKLNTADLHFQNYENLRIALQEGEYHILHLQGSLSWSNAPAPHFGMKIGGNTVEISVEQLRFWLEDSSVQMVVWNGGVIKGDKWDSLVSQEEWVIESFLCGNVVSLVTWQEIITPEFVHRFLVSFYSHLVDTYDFENAVIATRRVLATELDRTAILNWSIPVLLSKPWDGRFLNFLPPEDADEIQPVEFFAHLIDEPMSDVHEEEAPDQIQLIADRLEEYRLHIISGKPDVNPFEVGRLAARMLVESGKSRRTMRYPRYEPVEDFLYHLRELNPGVTILLDTADLGPLSYEMDALIDLVNQRQIYVLVTLSDESLINGDSDASRWFNNHPNMFTVVQEQDFSQKALQHMINRQITETQKNGILHPKTEIYLQEKVKDKAAFTKIFADLTSPGKITHLFLGPLAGQRIVNDDKLLSSAIQDAIATPKTTSRWFINELNLSEQVLIATLVLLSGVPTYLFTQIYQSVVNRLRRVFHLDLQVLPVRASLRDWQISLVETRRQFEGGMDAGFIEFRSSQQALEILDILRQEYLEWLTEMIPVFKDILRNGETKRDDNEIGRTEIEQQVLREAVSRALGAIATHSIRSLQQVVKQIEHVLVEAPKNNKNRSEWGILTIPGQVFSLVIDSGKESLRGQIRKILNEWRQHSDLNFQLSSISAYGQLARRTASDNLIPPLLVSAREAQVASEQAMKVIWKQKGKPSDQLTRAKNDHQASEEVRRAIAYSLRNFSISGDKRLEDLYERLASDHDLGTRMNIAVAMARSTSDPEVVIRWLEGWIQKDKWHSWWTASASTVSLYETGKISREAAASLFWQLVLCASRLANRQNKTYQELGQDMAWAMKTCLDRSRELSNPKPTLKPTIALLIQMFNRSSQADAVLKGIFTRFLETGEYTRMAQQRAMIEILTEWLKPETYQLDATPRLVAIEVLIGSSEVRRQQIQAHIRSLVEFEDFDYRWVQGIELDTLSLLHLGVGGVLLRTLLDGDDTTLLNALPFLSQIASLGSNEPIRALSPFVLSNLGVSEPTMLPIIIKNLRKWSSAPQPPLQMSAVDVIVLLYSRLPADNSDGVMEILLHIAEHGDIKTRQYLLEKLPEISNNRPTIASDLASILYKQTAPVEEVSK